MSEELDLQELVARCAALQAEVVRLQAKMADAWDEGYRAGYDIGYKDEGPGYLHNPYRPLEPE